MNTGKTATPNTIDEIGIVALGIAETVTPKLSAQEQALFIAGFQECFKWQSLLPTEQSAEQDRWIAVSSGALPERATEESRLSVDVIIWDDGPVIGYYNFLRKHWRRGLLVVYPTHWQNFPPAPSHLIH